MRNTPIVKLPIDERWKLETHLYAGTISDVFLVTDLKKGGQKVIKLGKQKYEYYSSRESQAYAWIMAHCKERPIGIVPVVDRFPSNDTRAYDQKKKRWLVMPCLGPNLSTILKTGNGTMSLPSTLNIGIQMLETLKVIHRTGIVHRDIAPWNLLLGGRNDPTFVYLISFNAAQIIDPAARENTSNKTLRKELRNRSPLFSSAWSHHGMRISWRDDLLSLGYVLVYLFNGCLPWHLQKDYNKVGKMKNNIDPETLTKGMPDEVCEYIKKVQSLKFSQTPDYNAFKALLQYSLKCGRKR